MIVTNDKSPFAISIVKITKNKNKQKQSKKQGFFFFLRWGRMLQEIGHASNLLNIIQFKYIIQIQ